MPQHLHIDQADASGAAGQRCNARAASSVVAAPAGLAVCDLTKTIGRRRIVDNVSFALARGETVGLLGPNGAGKTTIFNMVCGLMAVDRGRIMLDGTDITRLPMYRRGRLGIGYLPQQSSIFSGLTVEQNIAAIIEHRVADHATRLDYVQMVLEEFQITHLRDASPVHLSGGQRRRVEIARTLAAAPQFVLFDEPFAGVDPIVIDDVRDLIKQCTKWGIGILITDHNVRETLELVDRALVVDHGAVVSEGSPAEIVSDREVRRLYLGAGFSW